MAYIRPDIANVIYIYNSDIIFKQHVITYNNEFMNMHIFSGLEFLTCIRTPLAEVGRIRELLDMNYKGSEYKQVSSKFNISFHYIESYSYQLLDSILFLWGKFD